MESVPEEFAAQVTKPAFCYDSGTGLFLAATVCIRRRHEDPFWLWARADPLDGLDLRLAEW